MRITSNYSAYNDQDTELFDVVNKRALGVCPRRTALLDPESDRRTDLVGGLDHAVSSCERANEL